MSRPQKEGKGWGWGEILAAAVGIGAAVAAGAAVVSALAKEEEEKSKMRLENRTLSKINYSSQPITLAVDATSKRCGGFLKLPHSRTIYYYSVDWSRFFTFPEEPDKFEMTNALIALKYFSSYILPVRSLYGEMNVKTDSTFYLNEYTKTDYRETRREIDHLKEQMEAEFLPAFEPSDEDMVKADRLSRNNPLGPWPDDYHVKNVSLEVEMYIYEILQYVPCTRINTSTRRTNYQ